MSDEEIIRRALEEYEHHDMDTPLCVAEKVAEIVIKKAREKVVNKTIDLLVRYNSTEGFTFDDLHLEIEKLKSSEGSLTAKHQDVGNSGSNPAPRKRHKGTHTCNGRCLKKVKKE